MKLCIDCKWHGVAGISSEHVCTRHKPDISLVTGEAICMNTLCEYERTPNEGCCGYDGKYWEAK